MCGGVDADLRGRSVRGLAGCDDVRAVFGACDVELHFRSVCSFDKLCKFVVITEHVGFCLVRHGVDNSTGLEGNDLLADLAGYGKAEQTFFAVAYAVAGVRGEAHGGHLLFGEVVTHILHADLLCGAEHDAQLAFADDACFLQRAQAVQRNNCRTFVIGNAAAECLAVAYDHGVRVAVPAFAGRHDVKVRHNNGVFFALAELCVHRIIVAVLRLNAVSFRNFYRLIHSGCCVLAERIRAVLWLCD